MTDGDQDRFDTTDETSGQEGTSAEGFEEPQPEDGRPADDTAPAEEDAAPGPDDGAPGQDDQPSSTEAGEAEGAEGAEEEADEDDPYRDEQEYGEYDEGEYDYDEYDEYGQYEDDSEEDDEDEWEEYEDEEEEEEEEEDELGQKKMTLVEHLDEFRMRIIRAGLGLLIGMAVALCFGRWTFAVLQEPYVRVLPGEPPVVLSPTEAILLYIRIALYVGLILSSPWVFWQLWAFVAAGLYEREKRYVHSFVPFSAALFIIGALFFLKIVSIPILTFLLGFSKWLGLRPMIRFSEHVAFMTNMMLVFGICFQMPIAVLLLAKVGLVTVKTLSHYRRHVIVGILIIAAFTTSPSPVDQIALAVPMWALYELGILLAWFLVERKRREEEQADAED